MTALFAGLLQPAASAQGPAPEGSVPTSTTGSSTLAENVGCGSTLGVLYNAFMRSSGHRSNILGSYNCAGTGQAFRGGDHSVVHVFMCC